MIFYIMGNILSDNTSNDYDDNNNNNKVDNVYTALSDIVSQSNRTIFSGNPEEILFEKLFK